MFRSVLSVYFLPNIFRLASSTTAAPAGTGSIPWTSWATTARWCATRRTGTPAKPKRCRRDSPEASVAPEERPVSASAPTQERHFHQDFWGKKNTVESSLLHLLFLAVYLFTMALCTVLVWQGTIIRQFPRLLATAGEEDWFRPGFRRCWWKCLLLDF